MTKEGNNIVSIVSLALVYAITITGSMIKSGARLIDDRPRVMSCKPAYANRQQEPMADRSGDRGKGPGHQDRSGEKDKGSGCSHQAGSAFCETSSKRKVFKIRSC